MYCFKIFQIKFSLKSKNKDWVLTIKIFRRELGNSHSEKIGIVAIYAFTYLILHRLSRTSLSFIFTTMKLVPINVKLSSSILCFKKIFKGSVYMGGDLYLALIFFNMNPQIWQQNCKVQCSNCLDTNFPQHFWH